MTRYNKMKTVGTDEMSDGFLPRLNYTSVESESTYSVFIKPFRKFFGQRFALAKLAVSEAHMFSFQEKNEKIFIHSKSQQVFLL